MVEVEAFTASWIEIILYEPIKNAWHRRGFHGLVDWNDKFKSPYLQPQVEAFMASWIEITQARTGGGRFPSRGFRGLPDYNLNPEQSPASV